MATGIRALGLRDKLKPMDIQDLTSDSSSAVPGGSAPGAAGYTPSPHGLSSAHHSGEIATTQASWAAYAEGAGTNRPAYNANRMTGALAHVLPDATETYDLGDATKWWRQLFVSQINAAVYAENVIQLLGGWFVVGHGQGTLQMPTAYLQVETATVLGSIIAGVQQVETATVTGTATDAGSMTVTVTAAGMGSTGAVPTAVPFLNGATSSELAASIRAALSFLPGLVAWFTIGGAGADVALTAKTAAANDGTMNIALSGASAQGFPDHASSTNTLAGVASGAGTVSVTVAAAAMNGGVPITVTTGLNALDGWTATQVATMLAANLPTESAVVGAFFTITSSGPDLIFTTKAYTVANDATMNVAIANGTCVGLTSAPTSANTTAGGDRTDIDFGAASPTIDVNDFITIKGHDITGTIKNEYMKATAFVSGTTWTVTRNLNGLPAVPVWAEGTPWLNLGNTTDGRIELNAADTPQINVIVQGATWDAQTEMVRVGDLNANWGYDAETYGVAMGRYNSGYANVCIDSTNGLRLRSHDTTKIQLEPDGDIFVGTDVGDNVDGSKHATINLAIFTTNAQTYNGETVNTGDILFGDNGASKANIFWDKSAGKLQFRGGTTMQCEIDTDGSLTAGAGKVVLDAAGISVATTGIFSDTEAYTINTSGTVTGGLYGSLSVIGTQQIALQGLPLMSWNTLVSVIATAPTTYQAGTRLKAQSGSTFGLFDIYADDNATPTTWITTDVALFTIPSGNLGVGTATPSITAGVARALTVSAGVSGDSIAVVEIQGSRTVANGTYGGLIFFHQATVAAEVLGVRRTADDEAALDFYTKKTGVAIAKAMRITEDQHVVLNTKLVVGTGTRSAMEISIADADLYVGSDTQDGTIYVRNQAGTANITLEGTSGDATFKNGLNVGAATAAGAGAIKAATIALSSTAQIDGRLTIGTTATRKALDIDPANADLYVGSDSQAGAFYVRLADGTYSFGITNEGYIRTNQTAAATTLGNVAAKLPIYGPTGTLVGYIPIYDAIT
ncbi:MAG: hypothetical protein Q7O66_16630 [Dehalococcoidia bacterium]|nr:hypothetical protein [Dehalococcoidia bacterium]